jgi:hypothetical protein
VVVVVRMRFGPLGSANGRHSTVALIVTLFFLVFRLSAFSLRFGGSLSNWFWMGRLNLVAPKVWVRERDLGTGRPWARNSNAAYTASYAGEHTAKFALDPRLSRRPLQHGLRPLHRLWQW